MVHIVASVLFTLIALAAGGLIVGMLAEARAIIARTLGGSVDVEAPVCRRDVRAAARPVVSWRPVAVSRRAAA